MKLKHLSMLSLIALGVFATTSCGLKKESSNVSTTNPSITTPTYEGYYSSVTTHILSNSTSLKSTLNQIVSSNVKRYPIVMLLHHLRQLTLMMVIM